ncbi:MAG: ribonuclease [Casimicrobiaceae bacterium]
MSTVKAWRAVALAATIAIAPLAATPVVAKSSSAALPDVSASALPAEVRKTMTLISRGGPFPYSRDGIVFGNREKLLPNHKRGYYHEYTVPTPGERTRGARRVICGGDLGSLAECYYSDDHYQSFRRVQP